MPAILDRALWAIESSESDNFVDLVILSGLDPASDFRAANFDEVDFSDRSLQGFDFTQADFTGAILGNADFTGAILDGAVFLPGQQVQGERSTTKSLHSVLSALMDIAVNGRRAEERARAIRDIDQLFPKSPTARQLIRERRSADKSRAVRSLAWQISGETSHPSLPLYETIVRGGRGDAAKVAVNDIVRKKSIDEIDYEVVSSYAIEKKEIGILKSLDKKGFHK